MGVYRKKSFSEQWTNLVRVGPIRDIELQSSNLSRSSETKIDVLEKCRLGSNH